jgi:uracil-DNA glycosylase
VLLLNTVLTVRAKEPHSHQNHGWERFTDAVIQALAQKPEPVMFVLWGNAAAQKTKLLKGTHHAVLTDAHPSPLSANKGFFGSRPFSTINRFLRAQGTPEIDWAL